MRRILLAAAVMLAIGAKAQAQTYFCTRPDEPRIPAYYMAMDDWEWERAERAVKAYLDEMQGYINCLNREVEAAAAEANDVVARWNKAVRMAR